MCVCAARSVRVVLGRVCVVTAESSGGGDEQEHDAQVASASVKSKPPMGTDDPFRREGEVVWVVGLRS